MTETRRLAVLANPKRDHLVADVVAALDSMSPEMLEPATAADIVDCVRDAADRGADTVVAVGGDGTQRSVAAGIVGSGTALGVVPGGTVNLLAQVLGLAEVEQAVAAIIDGSRRAIDVGRCNGDLFVLNNSSGYDATVIAEAARGHKERFGRLSFVRAAISAFRLARPTPVVVTIDGSPVFEGRAMSVIVTNVAERSSSDLRIAPDARFDDGVLDVIVVRAATVRATLRLAWAVTHDREPTTDDVIRATGAEIDVKWTRPVDGQSDGDATERTSHFSVVVEPGALDVHA